MKNPLTYQLWKQTYPYWVIGRIAALVLASLIFLYLSQIAQNFLKVSWDSKKVSLSYAKRTQ